MSTVTLTPWAPAMFGLVLVGVATAGCSTDGRDFEVGWMTTKLVAAGYVVSAPFADEESARIEQVLHGECIDATKEDKVDRLCILRCTGTSACRPGLITRGPLGENMGVMYRNATALVHRRCGYGGCGLARAAVFAPDPR